MTVRTFSCNFVGRLFQCVVDQGKNSLSKQWVHLVILGTQRRRLLPAPLPDTSSLGRKPTGTTGQWVDLPPLPGTMKESFEIKVYQIDDVERLQRRRQEEMEVSTFSASLDNLNDDGGIGMAASIEMKYHYMKGIDCN